METTTETKAEKALGPKRDRAVVLDELPLVRHGARAVLDALGLDISEDTAATRDAVAVVAAAPAEIAVVVIGLPADGDPLVAIERCKAVEPTPPVVALVAPRDHERVADLVAAGADVLVPRAAEPRELEAAIKAAITGEQLVAPVLRRGLVGSVELVPRSASELAAEPAGALSAREREVLALLAVGRTNKQIADALSLSLPTVKSHLVRIYAKLGVNDRAHAVQQAVNLGLLA